PRRDEGEESRHRRRRREAPAQAAPLHGGVLVPARAHGAAQEGDDPRAVDVRLLLVPARLGGLLSLAAGVPRRRDRPAARRGGGEPLARVAEDKVVVLGLVSTKKPALEDPARLRARIEEAARFVPLERLALSPQCGFASVARGNDLSPELQERKLRLVAEVAA